MSTKILLAAFKSQQEKGENVGEQICRKLIAEHREQLDYMVLDTGPDVEIQLQHALAADPAGVLMTHADGSLKWRHFQIEDHAYCLEVLHSVIPMELNRGLGSVQTPFERKIHSGFASEARSLVRATGLMETVTSLGTSEHHEPFWCNRAYFLALTWGRTRQKPVLLVRLGIVGDEVSKLTPMRQILELMIKKATEQNQP